MATKYLDKVGLAYFWSKIKAWCNSLFALDSDVVHKNSNEAITGIKEFGNSYHDSTRENEVNWESSSIYLRMQNYDKGTTPSNRKYANLLVLDRYGLNQNWSGRLGMFEACVAPEGQNWVDIAAFKNEVVEGEDAHEYSNLRVGYDENGIRFAFAPSTSEDRTYGQDILTRNWIPKDTRIVHTTGDEVVSGNKLFDGSIILRTAMTKGTPPATTQYKSLIFTDSNSTPSSFNNETKFSQIRATVSSAGASLLEFFAFKNETGSSDSTRISVGYDSNGNAYAIAPSTSSSRSNGGDIVTRDWIPNDTRIVHSTGNESIAGTKTFSNTISGSIDGTSNNVTGTVAIANGGTGATTRLNAVKALTNENVGTDATFFLTITDNWGKAGFTAVSSAKTVLGINNVPNIDTSKAIKAITRSGTTFTYTCLDDSTGTFTQQDNNTDTKVNVTLNTTTKAYILGTSTTPTSTATGVTAISDTGVYLDTTAGRLTATSFSGNGQNITLNTASRAVVTDANKKLAVSSVTSTELGYISGVTSAIQTQLNNKANDSSVVHLANTETITGHKFFTATADVSCNIAKGTNPNSKLYRGLSLSDNSSSGANDSRFGLFEGSVDTDGTTNVYMRAYDWTANSANNASIGIIYPKGGTPYTFTITPSSTSDNGTKIATTEWVRSATGNTALNAATATKLATARTIALTGALTGSASFDGSANANIELIRRACSNRNPSNPATTAPYYKVASLTASSVTETRNYNVTFLVENTYSSEFIGLLHIDVRYNNGSIASESYVKVGWRVGYTSNISVIVPETTVRDTVEIWAEIPLRWMGYRFTVVSDGTDIGTSNNWILYSNIQASSNTSLPTGWVITPEYATVDTIQDQNIGGTKTFLNEIYIKRANPYLHFIETDWAKGDTTGSTGWQGIYFRDKNEAAGSSILYHYNPISQKSYITFTINKMAVSTDTNTDAINFIYDKTDGAVYRPNTNGTILFGTSNYRWKEIWCTQNSINSSSDIRLKNSITNISDKILNAWDSVEWINFKYNDASEEKGIENARIHSGLIAQQIKEVFEDNKLDINKYGFFLYDKWNAQEAEYDEEGNLLSSAIEAGDQYGLRYTEALCIEAAYQRRKNKILENRISELENQLSSVLQTLEELKGVG